MTFGGAIREARRVLGVSQKDLAAQLKKEDGTPISPQYLNDIELDRRLPPPYLIEQLALLDASAALSDEGVEVEGRTYFRQPRPLVRIAARLSTDPRMHNRYRTTLTHELTHVRVHSFLWALDDPSQVLLKDVPA